MWWNKYLIIVFSFSFFGLGCDSTQQAESQLPFYVDSDFSAVWDDDSTSYSLYHSIQPLVGVNSYGDSILVSPSCDQWRVFNLFFSTCAGICPRLMSNLNHISDSIAYYGCDQYSISVDPYTDSSQRLAEYRQAMNIDLKHWTLLTGKRENLYLFARNSLFADKETGKPIGENDFLHSELVWLVDKQGHLRGIYNGTNQNDLKNLLNDLKSVDNP